MNFYDVLANKASDYYSALFARNVNSNPNLFNVDEFLLGYYLTAEGKVTSSSKRQTAVSDFIEIEPGVDYIVSCNRVVTKIGYVTYEADKETVVVYFGNTTQIQETRIEANANAKYVRVWFNINNTEVTLDNLKAIEPQLVKA